MLRNALRGLRERRAPSATKVLYSLDGDEGGLLSAAKRSAISGAPERYVLNTRPLRVENVVHGIKVSTLGLFGTGIFSRTVTFSTHRVK